MALVLEKIQLEDSQNVWQENSRPLFYWCAYGRSYIYIFLFQIVPNDFDHQKKDCLSGFCSTHTSFSRSSAMKQILTKKVNRVFST